MFLLVVANHVADRLAQEALDALVVLLHAVDVVLLHAVRAVGLLRPGGEGRHARCHLVVDRDVVDEVPRDRKVRSGFTVTVSAGSNRLSRVMHTASSSVSAVSAAKISGT